MVDSQGQASSGVGKGVYSTEPAHDPDKAKNCCTRPDIMCGYFFLPVDLPWPSFQTGKDLAHPVKPPLRPTLFPFTPLRTKFNQVLT